MTLGLLYAALFGVGLVYAFLATILGWISDHDFGNLHVDGAGHVDQPHPISGTVLATFVTGFGGGGTIAHYLLEWPQGGSLLAATVTGTVLAAAAFGALELLFSHTQAGSEFKGDEIVGREGEVITTIPAGGVGEIAYVVRGQRVRSAARSAGETALAKGSLVEIERMLGAVARVRLKESDKENES